MMKRLGIVTLALFTAIWIAGCGGGKTEPAPAPSPEVNGTSGTATASPGTSGTATTPGGTASSPGTTGTSEPPRRRTKKTKLAFVTNASANFWSYAEAGITKAGQDFDDIEVIYKVGDGTTGKQKQIIDDLLVSGVKGVAFSPIEPDAQVAMINEWSKSVPVICCDSDSPGSDRITYLGTDNIAAGYIVGDLVKLALPEGGKMMVFVGIADVANARERFQGLKDSLKAAETDKIKYEILGLKTDNVDFAKARRNAEDTLNAHPDIDAMVGLWEYNPPQILNALKEKDMLGKVKVVGFDENFDTLRAIDAGHCYGTVCQQPFKFGYDSIKLLRDVVVEGKSHADAGIPDDKLIYVPTKAVIKGGGGKYIKYCEGLLESVKPAKEGAKVEEEKVLPVQQARNLKAKIDAQQAEALAELEAALK